MFLGLDLGTTNVKAVVTDREGRAASRGSAPAPTYPVGDVGVEQDIEEIWSATVAAVAEALRSCDASDIHAVGVSSQGGALQILDADGDPVGRVISWLDGRGRSYDEKLTAELGKDWFAERIGHGGSTLTVGQLLRLRDEGGLPDGFRVAFVGDRIVRRLCGRAAHDATSLSLGMLYNPSLRAADPDLLGRLGLAEAQLPALLGPCKAAGGLTAAAAEAIGLRAGIPVSPAVHDQYASALAAGVVGAGDVMLGTGTAWVLLAVADSLPAAATDDAFICTHVVRGRYGQIVSLRNGGSAVSWAARMLGLEDAGGDEIDAMLAAAPPGSDGLTFWPFLAASGERLPAETAGRLAGLRLSHTREHVLRAVVEGLACELARHLRMLTEASVPVGRLVLCGGAAGSGVTPQIIADVTGLTVECLTEADTSAVGAAMIARALVEPGRPLAEIAGQMRPPVRRIEPGSERGQYNRLLERYLASLPGSGGG